MRGVQHVTFYARGLVSLSELHIMENCPASRVASTLGAASWESPLAARVPSSWPTKRQSEQAVPEQLALALASINGAIENVY